MIHYYIDGSAKDQMIGAGVVKINEFGFIEKHHFTTEHINPSSILAEGYSLEKTFELIKVGDLNKNDLIDIYTDCQKLYLTLMYNDNTEFNRSNFFTRQESNLYYLHLRNIYLELISKTSKFPIYHCSKTNRPRPLIKMFFKDEAEDHKYLQEAHTLSRKYLKETGVPTKAELKTVRQKSVPAKTELKAVRQNKTWLILKNNKDVLAESKRPLIALTEALKQTDAQNIKQIKLSNELEQLLRNTYKNKTKLSTDLKAAMKIIENHKLFTPSQI